MSAKQAVLLIHGIGEQKPMGTLRGFVDAVWTRHTGIHHPHVSAGTWSKPDNVSRSFELRRLTTSKNSAGISTDFYEFYWAHLMEGTSYGHVLEWARSLLIRWPCTVPRQLKPVYWLLLTLLAASLAMAAHALYTQVSGGSVLPPWLSLVASLVLLPAAGFLVVRVVGDAARYLHVAPANIQRRHEIRQAGVDLLKELHNPQRGYRRIIVVGHSLGSVIGYDILTHAWVDFHREFTPGKTAMTALDELEALAQLEGVPVEQTQSAQRRYLEELEANGCRWRVTDLVTMGSPLAHAAVLLATDESDLRRKQADREFPCCLPTPEAVQRDHVVSRRFSYEVDRGKKHSYRVPHHAAVFAPTRWTNLYFPSRAIVWGDLVGGPLRPVMGTGIRDVPVSTQQRYGLFTHTLYWSLHPEGVEAPHVAALREALNLTETGSNGP